MSQKKAIIIGAGPAGLTAAYELIKRTNIKPIVLEKSEHLGGISRTVNYRGNRIDIGGHRFFFKIGSCDELVGRNSAASGTSSRANQHFIPE